MYVCVCVCVLCVCMCVSLFVCICACVHWQLRHKLEEAQRAKNESDERAHDAICKADELERDIQHLTVCIPYIAHARIHTYMTFTYIHTYMTYILT